ncbi:MAG: 16S rRNA (cytosine(1402)-N(4))-methyltransferase RsmH [Mycoplasmataceae bacterium]|jgi:16S rRNA (cytosine1402-N4)-methyltransferase|nr:16S rRNA (cytosine(1402)-N(4))-methyltransferase RsmH [Mycoplasmataceae bacterium]
MQHIPVLLKETIDILNIKKNSICLDCTAGYGGHSSEILKKLSPKGKLYCFDQDMDAIDFLTEKFKNDQNVEIINSNFSEVSNFVDEKVDCILADLGVSSPQLDNLQRGFSYHGNELLDMRMNKNSNKTAIDVLNKYSMQHLIDVFRKYGDAKNAVTVVKKIIEYRNIQKIEYTNQFVEIIKNSLPKKELASTKHPAKVYFQALRIEVNDEINSLLNLLNQSVKMLNKDGILAIITFHSLERKIVLDFFKKLTTVNIPKEIPIINTDQFKEYELLTKKPILPSEEEIEKNQRSRSAALFAIRRIYV